MVTFSQNVDTRNNTLEFGNFQELGNFQEFNPQPFDFQEFGNFQEYEDDMEFENNVIKFIHYRDIDSLVELIDNTYLFDIKEYDNGPISLLEYAVYNNTTVEMVKFLIELGAKVNTENYWTPLARAIMDYNVEFVKALLEAGATLNEKNTDVVYRMLEYDNYGDSGDGFDARFKKQIIMYLLAKY